MTQTASSSMNGGCTGATESLVLAQMCFGGCHVGKHTACCLHWHWHFSFELASRCVLYRITPTVMLQAVQWPAWLHDQTARLFCLCAKGNAKWHDGII